MKTVNPEIDHIDPRWKEGRDYQLVCGLDLPINYNEVSRAFNTSKSNRFLPYRVTSNDLGCIPCEPGDLCLFWDPDTEEWVLEEFLREWWYDKTDRYVGGCRALEEWRQNNKGKVGRALQKNRQDPGNEVRKQWEFYNNNPDKLAQRNANIGAGVRRRDEADPTIRQRAGASIKEAKKRQFKCLQTGYVGNGSAVSQYQIKHGVDHKDPTNRIRLE